MNTLTGALTAEQAYKAHDTALALEVYACLREYGLPIEVQDMLVSEATRINIYDADGKQHGLWKEWGNGTCRERVYVHGKLRVHILTVRGNMPYHC